MDFGLIGEHLGHSFSKKIHESISPVTYELKEIAKEDLDAFMREKPFKGINVTIPYKEAVIPYLDELSPLAKRVGAVNVVVNREGRLCGFNTDVLGFIEELHHMGIDSNGKVAAILGDGGASKAVRVALEEEGASKIYIVSRKEAIGTISYEELRSHREIEIIVNATSVGMYPKNEGRLIDLDDFPRLMGFVDLVYNPLRTMTVLSAQEKGIKAEGGLYMLVAQAVKASELFLDTHNDEKTTECEFLRLLNEVRNIVLIGMPGCGKSTVGKALSEKLHLPYADLDERIVERIKMPIPDYFASFGEKSFRDEESKAIKELYPFAPMVISTGGGAILRKENVVRLKQNGRLYFLDRDLEKLSLSDDRPLSKDRKSLQNLYESRYSLYLGSADRIIKNNETPEEAIKAIITEEGQ